MCIRRRDISADAQVVLIKHHAEALIESQLNFLPGAEMDVAGQQNLDVVVAVALAEQIGIVAQTLHHFTLKLHHGTGGDFRGEVLRPDPQRHRSAGLQRLGGDIQGQLMVLREGDR